jgi:hypothetical protein
MKQRDYISWCLSFYPNPINKLCTLDWLSPPPPPPLSQSLSSLQYTENGSECADRTEALPPTMPDRSGGGEVRL